MAKLKGNLSSLVSPKVKDDKRNQLVESQPIEQKVGRKSVQSYSENHVATRLLLPESLKQELDIFYIKNKNRISGKNEFLIAAVRNHLDSQKKQFNL